MTNEIDLSVEGRVDVITEVIAQSNELLEGDYVMVIYGRHKGDGVFDVCMSSLDIDRLDVKGVLELVLKQCSADIYPSHQDMITNEKHEAPLSAKIYSISKELK